MCGQHPLHIVREVLVMVQTMRFVMIQTKEIADRQAVNDASLMLVAQDGISCRSY